MTGHNHTYYIQVMHLQLGFCLLKI